MITYELGGISYLSQEKHLQGLGGRVRGRVDRAVVHQVMSPRHA